MSRHVSIERILSNIATEKLPKLRKDFALRETDTTANDAVFIGINDILGGLRAALDYANSDIMEVVKPVGTPAPTKKPRFPFAHPTTAQGAPRSPADTLNYFEQRWGKTIKGKLPKVYDVLKAVQGAAWLHELIESVNHVKHNDNVRLGPRELWIGDQGQLVVTGDQAHFVLEPGAGVMFKKDGVEHKIKGPLDVTTARPVPAEMKDFAYIHERITDADFKEKWLDCLEDWNKKVRDLVAGLYRHLP